MNTVCDSNGTVIKDGDIVRYILGSQAIDRRYRIGLVIMDPITFSLMKIAHGNKNIDFHFVDGTTLTPEFAKRGLEVIGNLDTDSHLLGRGFEKGE